MSRRSLGVGGTLGASNIEKATVSVKKEMRGATGETHAETTNRNAAEAATSSELTASSSKKVYTEAEKLACSIDAMKNGGTCEACQ